MSDDVEDLEEEEEQQKEDLPAVVAQPAPSKVTSAPQKKPAASTAVAKKKPQRPAAVAKIHGFTVMHYPAGAVALRATTGAKKQIFQILNRSKTQASLDDICWKAGRKIAGGEEPRDVAMWAKAQAAQ